MKNLIAQADIYNPAINIKLGNFATGRDGFSAVQIILRSLINITFGVAGLIFFFMLLRGGYEYLTAGGDKESVQKATKRLTTAFVGISIIFSVYAFLFIIETLFGIALLDLNVPAI